MIEQALADAGELSYEDIQQLAWGSLNDYAGALRELGAVLMQFPVAFPVQGN